MVSGQQHDAAAAPDIVEPCLCFLEGVGLEDMGGADTLVEGMALEAVPGDEFFHDLTLPAEKDSAVSSCLGLKVRALRWISTSLI